MDLKEGGWVQVYCEFLTLLIISRRARVTPLSSRDLSSA